MTDRLNPTGEDENHVFGLISSAWGGTFIEAWSSPDALNACGTPPHENPDSPQNSFSYLWNAMIHPFTRHSIYGVVWYQGKYCPHLKFLVRATKHVITGAHCHIYRGVK